jgi:tRNA pseudouridine38-40 synthase
MDKLVGAVSRPLKSLWRRASLISLRGESTDDLNQLTVNETLRSTIGSKRRRDEEETDRVVGEDGTLSKRPRLETKTTDQEVVPVLGEMALDEPPAQGLPSPSLATEDQKAPTGWAGNARSPSKDKRKQRALRGTRPEGQANRPPKPRLGTKRQCAMLIGFCGTGCSGMQM